MPHGLFVDPPAALLRKPTAAPIIMPAECIALALTAAQWSAGRIMDPNGDVVQLVLKSLRHEGYKIVPMERADYEH
jgi:hypothetical protein